MRTDDGAAAGKPDDGVERTIAAGVDDVALRGLAGGDEQRAHCRRRPRTERTDQGEVAGSAFPAQRDLALRRRIVNEPYLADAERRRRQDGR